MLKNKWFYLFAFCLPLFGLRSVEVFTEAKAAYFRPTDHLFRSIYGNGSGLYGLEVSCSTWKDLYVWSSASVFSTSGNTSLGTHSRVLFVPLALGLKYFFPYKWAHFYLGARGVGTYLHTHDDSPFVIKNLSKWGGGGIFKLGVLLDLKRSFFIDLFTDYSIMKVNNNDSHHGKIIPQSANLSGWSIGAAIGYRFGGCKTPCTYTEPEAQLYEAAEESPVDESTEEH